MDTDKYEFFGQTGRGRISVFGKPRGRDARATPNAESRNQPVLA